MGQHWKSVHFPSYALHICRVSFHGWACEYAHGKWLSRKEGWTRLIIRSEGWRLVVFGCVWIVSQAHEQPALLGHLVKCSTDLFGRNRPSVPSTPHSRAHCGYKHLSYCVAYALSVGLDPAPVTKGQGVTWTSILMRRHVWYFTVLMLALWLVRQGNFSLDSCPVPTVI
jgi:hypothetical protein